MSEPDEDVLHFLGLENHLRDGHFLERECEEEPDAFHDEHRFKPALLPLRVVPLPQHIRDVHRRGVLTGRFSH